MEVVTRPEVSVVGAEVVAEFGDLGAAVPAAWKLVFDRRDALPAPPDGAFVEVSRALDDGRYREVVGAFAGDDAAVPQGMTRVRVPAGRFLHHRHRGPVQQISSAFGDMYAWAAEHGLRLGPVKVDVGYRPDGSDATHDLFIDVLDSGSSQSGEQPR